MKESWRHQEHQGACTGVASITLRRDRSTDGVICESVRVQPSGEKRGEGMVPQEEGSTVGQSRDIGNSEQVSRAEDEGGGSSIEGDGGGREESLLGCD